MGTLKLDPETDNQGHYFLAAARLKPGITLERAKAVLDASSAAYRQRFPTAQEKGDSFTATTLKEQLVQGGRKSIWVLAAAVGFVLLIACANVANLLLARAESRKREIAIRGALGAGCSRIVRQLLMESFLLASAGAVFGLLLGFAGIRPLLAVNTAGLPRVGVDGALVSPDWRVLLFTVAITSLTALLFGLLPAWHAARKDLNTVIRESAGRSGSGFRQNSTRTLLVITEVALAVVLLVVPAL